eukprot:8746107-Lingulodinium_polyedra.AAC.1
MQSSAVRVARRRCNHDVPCFVGESASPACPGFVGEEVVPLGINENVDLDHVEDPARVVAKLREARVQVRAAPCAGEE